MGNLSALLGSGIDQLLQHFLMMQVVRDDFALALGCLANMTIHEDDEFLWCTCYAFGYSVAQVYEEDIELLVGYGYEQC